MDDGFRAFSDEQRAAVCRHSFEAFAAAAFLALNGTRYDPAPYLSLMAGKLESVWVGDVQNLIITVPPRALKSFFASVAFPAFVLGHDPTAQIMCVSHGQTLSRDLAAKRQRLMKSDFYRMVFGDVVARASLDEVRTRDGGVCYAVSMNSGVTGKGADYLIFDDPQRAQDVGSKKNRDTASDRLRNTFLSRRNDPSTARIITTMQRLHEEDFVGQLLEMEGLNTDLVNLPAIAERDEVYAHRSPGGMKLFERKEGEVLHPERLSMTVLEDIRKLIGEMAFASQYQQRPAPMDGGFVKTSWFQRYGPGDLPDEFDEIIQSYDTANTISEYSDWTVCTTWGRVGRNLYLLHVHRAKLLFPDLVRCVLMLAQRWRPSVILVEDHASGTQLVQTLRDQGFGKCRAIKPVGDKETRLINQTALIESGRVWIPANADWLDDYIRELILFPNAKHDDQVDSTSQALEFLAGWFEGKGLIEFMRRDSLKAQGIPEDEDAWLVQFPPGQGARLLDQELVFGEGPDNTLWIANSRLPIVLWPGFKRLELRQAVKAPRLSW